MFGHEMHEYIFYYSIPELNIAKSKIIVEARSAGKAEDNLIAHLERVYRKKLNVIIEEIDDLGVKNSA